MVSGKVEEDRNTICNYILCELANKRIGKERYFVKGKGKKNYIQDKENADKILDEQALELFTYSHSAKIYNPEQAAKKVVMQLFDLDYSQCYGSDIDKAINTHVLWEKLPEDIRAKYGRLRKGLTRRRPASGPMTSKELEHVFANEICAKMDENCWSRMLFCMIQDEKYELAVINGNNGGNHASLVNSLGGKVIYLIKGDDAIDTPLGEYSVILDNKDSTMKSCIKKLAPFVQRWISDSRI